MGKLRSNTTIKEYDPSRSTISKTRQCVSNYRRIVPSRTAPIYYISTLISADLDRYIICFYYTSVFLTVKLKHIYKYKHNNII